MKANTGLQMALNACEDSKIDLENEVTSLKNQMKSMTQALHGSEKVREEMDELQAALAESEKINHCLNASYYKLEIRNETLSHQIEAITQEISDILPEREMDKRKIKTLSQHIQVLQQQLEEAKRMLDERDGIIYNKDVVINQQKASMDELTTIGQGLREEVKNLEDQLELALVNEEGSFLHPDGTFSVATENRLSLAEELGLMAGFQQEESDDDVEVDDVLMGSEVTAWELKEEVEEDSCFEEMKINCMKVIEVSPEEITEIIKHEEVVEVAGNKEVKDFIQVDEVEGMKWINETVETEEISHLEEVNEEDKAVRPEKIEMVGMLEEVEQTVRHEEVRDLIKLEQEKDVKEISSILAEEACHHEEMKPAIGHKEVRDIELEIKAAIGHKEVRDIELEIKAAIGHEEVREIELEIKATKPEEDKWATAHPEEVKESVMHQEVEEAVRTEEAKDFIRLKEVLKHEEEREEVGRVVEVDGMARLDEVQAVEVEQTQFCILDEDLAPGQNSGAWLDEACEKIKRGALITGAIGLGVFLLWKIKS
ncbi:golgin subfamily B member 1-like [Clupea harengus]|uniref:Golgin subfamily B member 1-like n=1 Tax=Clupea harengus TaxID=7950 RepID=A0A8M1KX86_CLUHA|nr:golgin subfamily B member 1-like [Clupea harengus]